MFYRILIYSRFGLDMSHYPISEVITIIHLWSF